MNVTAHMADFLQKLSLQLARHPAGVPDGRGCLLWTSSTTTSVNSRVKVTWPAVEEDRTVAEQERIPHMGDMIKIGGEVLCADSQGQALEVSHLCQNKLCINQPHLSLEPRDVNNEMRHCVNQGFRMHSHYGQPARLSALGVPVENDAMKVWMQQTVGSTNFVTV